MSDNFEIKISAEIVFATEKRQELITVQVVAGTTVAEAIESSPLQDLFPDTALGDCLTGIWGRLVERTHVLQEGDRIELYRPLQNDPRDARRERAATGKN